jgi:hypothetical protein
MEVHLSRHLDLYLMDRHPQTARYTKNLLGPLGRKTHETPRTFYVLSQNAELVEMIPGCSSVSKVLCGPLTVRVTTTCESWKKVWRSGSRADLIPRVVFGYGPST